MWLKPTSTAAAICAFIASRGNNGQQLAAAMPIWRQYDAYYVAGVAPACQQRAAAAFGVACVYCGGDVA